MSGKRTLVLGASTNPERYSFRAINSLLHHGHEVYAIGIREGKINQVEIKKDKFDLSNVDTITLYLGPQNQKPYFDYIKNLNPKRVIFNPGTENTELQNFLDANRIKWEEACTLVLLSTGAY